MQIKTAMRFNTAHRRERPKSGTGTTLNAGKDAQPQNPSFAADRNAKMAQPLWKAVGQFLTTLTTLVP